MVIVLASMNTNGVLLFSIVVLGYMFLEKNLYVSISTIGTSSLNIMVTLLQDDLNFEAPLQYTFHRQMVAWF